MVIYIIEMTPPPPHKHTHTHTHAHTQGVANSLYGLSLMQAVWVELSTSVRLALKSEIGKVDILYIRIYVYLCACVCVCTYLCTYVL